jgi:dynein heavy chain
VRAIEDYAKCLKIVNPKREKKAIAEAQVARLKENLRQYEEEFEQLQAKLMLLQTTIDEKTRQMDQLKANLQALQTKIDRGEKLVSSLAEEKANWIIRLAGFENDETNLLGDCLIAAAFMSYSGPFPSDYRETLNEMWLEKVKEEEVNMTKNFNFCDFLVNRTKVRGW